MGSAQSPGQMDCCDQDSPGTSKDSNFPLPCPMKNNNTSSTNTSSVIPSSQHKVVLPKSWAYSSALPYSYEEGDNCDSKANLSAEEKQCYVPCKATGRGWTLPLNKLNLYFLFLNSESKQDTSHACHIAVVQYTVRQTALPHVIDIGCSYSTYLHGLLTLVSGMPKEMHRLVIL